MHLVSLAMKKRNTKNIYFTMFKNEIIYSVVALRSLLLFWWNTNFMFVSRQCERWKCNAHFVHVIFTAIIIICFPYHRAIGQTMHNERESANAWNEEWRMKCIIAFVISFPECISDLNASNFITINQPKMKKKKQWGIVYSSISRRSLWWGALFILIWHGIFRVTEYSFWFYILNDKNMRFPTNLSISSIAIAFWTGLSLQTRWYLLPKKSERRDVIWRLHENANEKPQTRLHLHAHTSFDCILLLLFRCYCTCPISFLWLFRCF